MPPYQLRRLEEVSENHDSRRIPIRAADRNPGPYPYYGAQGIVDHVDNFIFDGSFVLVAEDGENLRSRNQDIALLAEGRFWVNNHAHILRGNSEASTRFLRYAINSADISGYVTGSTIPKLSQRNLRLIPIPCPPLEEQQKIVSLLGSLDDKIELNRRMNKTLELMARAIFKDWFVDFGPSRAKAKGRAPYLAPELWSLFPGALDDLGNPIGWRHGKLDDLIVLQRGFDLPKSKRIEGKFPIFAASGINGTHHKSRVLGPGVTTGRSGVIGNVFYVHEDFWPLNTSLWVKEYRNSSPAHAYFLLQTLDLALFNSGSAVPTLNRNHVHNLPIAVPSLQTIQGFDNFVSPLFQQKRLNEVVSQTLAETRDLLLPKLLSGEIRLSDAEMAVEAVA